MANCASTRDFEGRTLTCSRRNGHPGDHQGKIGPGLTRLWSEEPTTPELPVAVPRCESRFREDVPESLQGTVKPEIFQCELPCYHSGAHKVTFPKEEGGGFMPWSDAEAMKADAVIEATVDGADAMIVLDGTTGAPLDASPPIIEADIHAIEKTLAAVNAELIVAEREKKDATEEFKRVQNRQNAIVAELVRRINGEQPLPFTTASPAIAVPPVDADDDDENEAV